VSNICSEATDKNFLVCKVIKINCRPIGKLHWQQPRTLQASCTFIVIEIVSVSLFESFQPEIVPDRVQQKIQNIDQRPANIQRALNQTISMNVCMGDFRLIV